MTVINADEDIQTAEKNMAQSGLIYPFIAKPNSAGRNGTNVEKIHNRAELQAYMHMLKKDILVQQLIDDPLEFGVYYYRLPGEEKGRLSGIVGKDFLYVE